jgi:hypothetical protein
MSNAPANDFESTYRPPSALLPAKDLTVRLLRLVRVCIATAADELREHALRRAEQPLPRADASFDRFHRDVLRVEARRLL